MKLFRFLLGTAGAAAAGYGGYVYKTWLQYGNPRRPHADEKDPLLDRLMPDYDVVDRHRINVEAPAALTYEAAGHMDLESSPVVRAIFKTRELLFGGGSGKEDGAGFASKPVIQATMEMGWRPLAEVAGREIVMGAVTQPWVANPVFRGLEPEEFLAFRDPDFVKIAWTLRADPIGETACVFRTETRAVAFGAMAREKFRNYWAFLSPGIYLSRTVTLGPLKREAERQARMPTTTARLA